MNRATAEFNANLQRRHDAAVRREGCAEVEALSNSRRMLLESATQHIAELERRVALLTAFANAVDQWEGPGWWADGDGDRLVSRGMDRTRAALAEAGFPWDEEAGE